VRVLATLPQDDLNDVPAAARRRRPPGTTGWWQWGAMAREISDDVVRLFAAVGTHRELAKAVAERFGGTADTVALSGGYGMKQDIPPDLI